MNPYNYTAGFVVVVVAGLLIYAWRRQPKTNRPTILEEIKQIVYENQLKLSTMAGELQTLQTEVSETKTVVQSAIVLIRGLKTRLDEAIASGDPAALTALSESLNTDQQELADAIAANTPSDEGGEEGEEEQP